MATAGRPVQDREIGRLGDIAVTMDAELDRHGQPTDDYTLAAQVGQLTLDVITVGTFGAGADAAGLTRRIINAINAIDTELRSAKLRLVASETDMTRLQRKRGAPFEYQQEMAEKYGDLQRLQEELRVECMTPIAPPTAPTQDGAPTDYFRRDGSFAPPALDALQSDVGGTAHNAELTTREVVQAKRDTERLNQQLAAAGMAPVRALRIAPTARFALARQIGKALGIEVHYVSKNAAFEGVTHRGVAYLSEGMDHPELAIAGHEMLHALEQGDPQLGQQLREHVRGYLRDGVVADRQMREHVASGFQDVSERMAEREVLADINGAMWLDPRFWSALAQADHSLFRQAAYKFMEVASGLMGAMRGRFDLTQLVTDVEAVRVLMVSAWSQRNAARDAAVLQVGEPGSSGYNDAYENTTTRPGTTDAQRDVGRTALADLARRFGADRIRTGHADDRSAGGILGSRLFGGFVAGSPQQLVGQIAATPHDLAALAQVYRDPRFETFRVVFTQQGRIVGETGYSSRLPGAVFLPPTLGDHVAEDKARFSSWQMRNRKYSCWWTCQWGG